MCPANLEGGTLHSRLALRLWSAGFSAFPCRAAHFNKRNAQLEGYIDDQIRESNESLVANSAVLQSRFVEALVCHLLRHPPAASSQG